MRIIQLDYLSSAYFYIRPYPIQSIIMNAAFWSSGILALACLASCSNPSEKSVPPNKEDDVICADLALLGLQPGVKIIREDTYEAQFIDGQWQHVREQFLGRTDFEFSEQGELLRSRKYDEEGLILTQEMTREQGTTRLTAFNRAGQQLGYEVWTTKGDERRIQRYNEVDSLMEVTRLTLVNCAVKAEVIQDPLAAMEDIQVAHEIDAFNLPITSSWIATAGDTLQFIEFEYTQKDAHGNPIYIVEHQRIGNKYPVKDVFKQRTIEYY